MINRRLNDCDVVHNVTEFSGDLADGKFSQKYMGFNIDPLVVEYMMNVLIIDDHKMFLDGLSHVLPSINTHIAVNSATSLNDAMQYLRSDRHFELILLDLHFPDVDGLDILRICRKSKPLCPVLVISSEMNVARIYEAKHLGASGFVAKSEGADSVIEAMSIIVSGGMHFSDHLECTFKLLPKHVSTSKSPLSGRQQDVLELVCKGYNNKTIAELLFISVSTVKTHINAVFQILDAESRSVCIKKARDLGLV